jgi:hypothetical protein
MAFFLDQSNENQVDPTSDCMMDRATQSNIALPSVFLFLDFCSLIMQEKDIIHLLM